MTAISPPLNQVQVERWLKRLIRLAHRLAQMDEVPVACILLDGQGRLLAVGVNQRQRFQQVIGHAELVALARACRRRKNWRLPDVVAIVTLEPCVMCLGALIQARIQALYFGCADPKMGAAGSVCNLAQNPKFNHQIRWVENLNNHHCQQLMTQFFKNKRRQKSKILT